MILLVFHEVLSKKITDHQTPKNWGRLHGIELIRIHYISGNQTFTPMRKKTLKLEKLKISSFIIPGSQQKRLKGALRYSGYYECPDYYDDTDGPITIGTETVGTQGGDCAGGASSPC